MKKTCSQCGKEKELRGYYVKSDTGKQRPWCKACRAEYARKYYLNNKEKVLEVRRKYYLNNMGKDDPYILQQAIEYLIEKK